MILTTKTGPAACDNETRAVQCAVAGQVLDKCNVQDTPDRLLLRELPAPTGIVVELVVAEAMDMYTQKGLEVCEIFIPQRIAAEAGMRVFGHVKLKPAWSPDITQVDPEDGRPWDPSDKAKVKKLWNLVKHG